MAQSGFTPIVTYHSTTASAVPLAANLAPGELSLNINDMKLYCENSAGAVTLLASAAGATGTVSSVAVSGGTTGLTTSGGPITTAGTITLAGTLAVANGGTGVTTSTGTTNVVLSNSPTLVSPALGTPSALVGTNITGTASGLTAGNVTTNANLTGDVTSVGNATSIAAGVIVNADINASAAIVDTKLATISTALKVSNSATTATNANTASAIVARDASGNFSAGTITASLTGNASTVTTNANLTGDVTSVGNVATVPNATVISKVLTGYVSGAGTVAATDSILQAIQKLNGNAAASANLTGAVTSVGTATSLGSFTSAQLLAAVTGETGTGAVVFGTSPTLVTPALGTPASGVVTNLTGTASININGTVGATTATTGAFTTLSATGVATFAAGTVALPSITTSGDTNTGVYFPAADTVGITAGGTQRGAFSSTGLAVTGNITGSFKESIFIPAAGVVSRLTGGAVYSQTQTATNLVQKAGFLFSGTTAEYAQFYLGSPKQWNKGTVVARFVFAPTTTATAATWFELSGLARGSGDSLEAAFGTAQGILTSHTTADTVSVSADTAAITLSGTPITNDILIFQVKRNPANAGDTYTANALLLGVWIDFTMTALTDN
jgi:hypothetical protein